MTDIEMVDRERRDREGGTATAELAVALPAVVVVLAGVLAVGQAVLAQVQCVDAARAGARAATDQGGATILVLCICLLAMVLATAVAATGSAIVARHRAQAAADLGALAAADVLVGRAPGEPCAAAARVAIAQGAAVTDCEVSGTDVLVRASVEPRGPVAALGVAVAAARAGPGQLSVQQLDRQ